MVELSEDAKKYRSALTKKWRSENHEKVLEYQREYRRKNRKKINAKRRAKNQTPDGKAKIKEYRINYLNKKGEELRTAAIETQKDEMFNGILSQLDYDDKVKVLDFIESLKK